VLVVYDGAEEADLTSTPAHRQLALPLEHLGLAVDYAEVRAGLPGGSLAGRYAGVISYFTDDELADPGRWRRFVTRALDDGVPFVVVGHLGFTIDAPLAARLGLEGTEGDGLRPPLRLGRTDALVGLETRPRPGRDVPPVRVKGQGAVAHAEVVDSRGRRATPVFTTAWGGAALDPFVVQEGWRRRLRWVLDPFAFFARALRLPPMPVLDLTTENGSRLLLSHIDGDGFVSRAEFPGTPYSGEIIRREILERYPIPTTVSLIEAETGPAGLYPQQSQALEAIARGILALPYIEVATHTFSHPFDWARAATGAPRVVDPDDEDDDDDPLHLPVPGYRFDLRREIEGSVRYIDERLAPAHKKTRVVLWSGSAFPGEDALRLTEALGLFHMNGANADEPIETLSLTMVPSSGRPVGRAFQVYAPAPNEIPYTNDWRGPYYGFRRIVDFFRFTDEPRRLKPLSIYYHFYSGTKPAALAALQEAYEDALSRDVRCVWVSAYAAKVRQFQEARLFRHADGSWRIDGVGHLRTVRLPREAGWPDLDRSQGVVGVRDLPQGRYVALDGSPSVRLVLRPQPPPGPYLERTNGEIMSHRRGQRDGRTEVTLRLRGDGRPLSLSFGGCPAGGAVDVRRGTEIRGAHAAARSTDPLGEEEEVTVACRR
jgi:hypothetical protein